MTQFCTLAALMGRQCDQIHHSFIHEALAMYVFASYFYAYKIFIASLTAFWVVAKGVALTANKQSYGQPFYCQIAMTWSQPGKCLTPYPPTYARICNLVYNSGFREQVC